MREKVARSHCAAFVGVHSLWRLREYLLSPPYPTRSCHQTYWINWHNICLCFLDFDYNIPTGRRLFFPVIISWRTNFFTTQLWPSDFSESMVGIRVTMRYKSPQFSMSRPSASFRCPARVSFPFSCSQKCALSSALYYSARFRGYRTLEMCFHRKLAHPYRMFVPVDLSMPTCQNPVCKHSIFSGWMNVWLKVDKLRVVNATIRFTIP